MNYTIFFKKSASFLCAAQARRKKITYNYTIPEQRWIKNAQGIGVCADNGIYA